MDSTVADPLLGRVLDGRYRVQDRVARGGMATVYQALDLRLERLCALKVMRPGLVDDQDFARRFVREARSAARLSHPNVVSVYDQGSDEGTLFLAMEYVPGRTLRDVVRAQAPLPPTRALALLEPVLAALSAAHAAGIVHRDIKPENVLIADDGRVKVADFGLARAVSADTQHTATAGVLIGTVSYLAPELVVEDRADARCDVYAVGVLLFELLTGRKPHEGDSPIQVAYKHVHEDVPPPSRLVPGIPAYVDALVARATARDRGLRPADARVMLHQAHRVADALHHGVAEDPDLTADLALTVPVPFEDSIDYLTEDPSHDDGPGHWTHPPLASDEELRDELGVDAVLSPGQAARAGTGRSGASRGRSPRHGSLRNGHPHAGSARHGAPRTPASPGPPAAAPRGRPRRHRGPLLLLLVLLLATGAAVGGWWLGIGRWTTTPGLINLSAPQARSELRQQGLDFTRGEPVHSETVPAGEVLATEPAGGERVLDDGAVEVVVSLGPERYDVPRLAGDNEEAAERRLERSNLGLGAVVERFSERSPAGEVLRSDPDAGARLKPGAVVDVVISKGRRPIEVPDLTGDLGERAERRLDGLRLEVTTTTANSDTVPEGEVITQRPSSGALFRGDEVELVVSEGPVLVEVPNLRAVGIAEATERLEAEGFEVRTRESAGYLGLGYVSSADPGFGEQVPRGSTVTLSLV